jgi:hypothetical protein
MKKCNSSTTEGKTTSPAIEDELSFSDYNLLDAMTSELTKEDIEVVLRRPLSQREVFLIKQIGFVACLLFRPKVDPLILEQLLVHKIHRQVEGLLCDEFVALALTESELAVLRLIGSNYSHI